MSVLPYPERPPEFIEDTVPDARDPSIEVGSVEEESENIAIRIKILLKWAWSNAERGDNRRIELCLEDAFRLASGDNEAMARVHYDRGLIYEQLGRYSASMGDVIEAARLLKLTPRSKRTLRILQGMGEAYGRISNKNDAQESWPRRGPSRLSNQTGSVEDRSSWATGDLH